MKAGRWAVLGVVGVVLAAGCSDEEWVYRPRRDAGAMDVGMATVDGAVDDRGVTGDVGTPIGDVGVDGDGGVTNDVGVVAPGLVMQAQGMATTSGGSLTIGTLELSETGFEVGAPACVGGLCLTGGLLP